MSNYKFPVKQASTSIPSPQEPDLGKIKFSFKFYDPKHETSHNATFRNPYPKEFLIKLKELETWTVEKFIDCREHTYRIHPIDWNDSNVSYRGFKLSKEYDENAWQFSIKGNKHGRVHGFLIENIFYVVWLDPNHKVYPKDS